MSEKKYDQGFQMATEQSATGKPAFEGTTLFAIAVYWLFAYLITRGIQVSARRVSLNEQYEVTDNYSS